MRSILYIFRHSAWHGRSAVDGLDALMASCAMELEVNALFLHEGVFVLNPAQSEQSVANRADDATVVRQKLANKPFAALFDFGCEHVYVCEKSLKSRGLSEDGLMLSVELSSREEITTLIDQHDQVLVF